jgi:hypothetical protein
MNDKKVWIEIIKPFVLLAVLSWALSGTLVEIKTFADLVQAAILAILVLWAFDSSIKRASEKADRMKEDGGGD